MDAFRRFYPLKYFLPRNPRRHILWAMELLGANFLAIEWLIHAAMVIGFLLAVVLITHILLEPRSPSGTLAWLLAIVLIPFIGVPLYLLIGGRKTRRAAARKNHLDFPEPAETKTRSPIDEMLLTYGFPPSHGGHRITLCKTGEEIYTNLVSLIESARKSIYISTFIFRRDAVGAAILELLIRKASQGLDVRLLLDGVGSMHTGKRFLAPLVAAGGRYAHFIPVIHRPFHGRTNLRNHRKTVIVDGAKVLAGGTNIGLEYIGPVPQTGRWCDLSFVLEGPAVATCSDIFLSDWLFASGDAPDAGPATTVSNTNAALAADADSAIVQVIPSGPDVPSDAFYDSIITAIFAAKSRLWIVTPYFIPDEPLAQAIGLAARRGVDVRILTPARSNHVLADLIRNNYLRIVQKSGGMVMLYTTGMMHAKVLITDDLAIIGSANIDLRSLLLNYEVAMLIYSQPDIETAAQWVQTLMPDCRIGIAEASLPRKLFEGMLRTLAPLV
jgi:cardiolipin synthase A/B